MQILSPESIREDIGELNKNLPRFDSRSGFIEQDFEAEQSVADPDDMPITDIQPQTINLQLQSSKITTPQQAGERARKVYDMSVKEELPLSFVDKNFEFYDQGAYQQKVERWKETLDNMPTKEQSAIMAFIPLGNLFGLTSYMSRKGWLFNEESRGDTSAFFDALEQFHAEMNRPEINFMGKTIKLPDPAYIAGGIAKTATEFAMLPGLNKATTWLGKLAETSGKFAMQTAVQAPAQQEEMLPTNIFIKQRAVASLQSGIIGAGVGIAGKFIKNPLYRIPTVTGGFMTLTALEGGTAEQVLETGIQILGFEVLGMAQSVFMGKGKMKDVVAKAKEKAPELEKVPDTEIEKILKVFAKEPTKPVEAQTLAKGTDITPQSAPEAGKGVSTEVPAQLEPVGTGKTKPSRLSERFVEKVNKINKELTDTLGQIEEYNATSFLEQASLIANLETKNREKLIRIAERKEIDTGGILNNAAWVHLAKEATIAGDVELTIRLENAKASRASTRMGQEIVMLRDLDERSGASIIGKVKEQKAKNLDIKLKKQGTSLKTEQEKMSKEMKDNLKKNPIKMDRFVKFLESIRCA